MTKSKNVGDFLLNAVFIIGVVLVVVFTGSRRFASPAPAAREDFLPIGSESPVDVQASFEELRPTVIVFIDSTCRFCTENMPFYRELSALSTQEKCHLMFVSGEPRATVEHYLQENGLAQDTIASPRGLRGIPGTPSIVILDARRLVSKSWAGKLTPRQQEQVRAVIMRTRSGSGRD